MKPLRDILHGRELFYVEPAQSVFAVAGRMSELHVGAILVIEGGRICGLFSERDLMTRVVVAGRDPRRTQVGEVMSRDLAVIDETATSDDAMALMRRQDCRHLPVMRGDQVVGMVSMRDLMNYELELKTDEIDHMRAYISLNG